MARPFPKYSGELLKDERGSWRTRSLFFEMATPKDRETFTPLYTLKEEDYESEGVHYKSLYKIYMEVADPTEYEFAQTAFGSWNHWVKLQKATWLRGLVKEWRDELEIKIASNAIKAMVRTAETEGSKGTAAARYLADRGWEKGTGKGRPSKEKVEREAKKLVAIHEEVDEDIERMSQRLN